MTRRVTRSSFGVSWAVFGAALVVALTPAMTAPPLEEIWAHAKLALLVGSEGEGLTRDALAAATVTARIPMTLAVDSLNVTTAASIAMYHCFAERRQ